MVAERYIGAHCSTAGGLHKAVERIAALKGTALQIFTRNQRQWQTPPLESKEIEDFKAARADWGSYPVASHDSYLINLASPEDAARKRSMQAFAGELARCSALGVELVVTHPGNFKGKGDKAREAGLERYVQALDGAIALAEEEGDLQGANVRILLETTAGMGSSLGADFHELAWIIEQSGYPEHLGVCLDTCHAFCAGYDLRTPEAYATTMDAFNSLVGIERIGLLHLNDSKNPFASRKDRHEHIGKGEMGVEPFRLLLQDTRLAGVPMVLETPKDKEGAFDRMNLSTLWALLE